VRRADATWRSGPLTPEHHLTEFTCGTEPLDDWLMQHALRANRQNTARTYVWATKDDLKVVAYYSIAPTEIIATGLPRSAAGGHSRIPGFLLARLALDQSLQGQGLGRFLLFDALERVCQAAATAAGRLVVVDPIDDLATAFYTHHGFRPIAGSSRLFMPVAAIQQALDL